MVSYPPTPSYIHTLPIYWLVPTSLCIQADKKKDPDKVSELRSKEQTLKFMQEIASQRTEKAKSQLKTKYGVSIDANPLLQLPIDLHRSVGLFCITCLFCMFL